MASIFPRPLDRGGPGWGWATAQKKTLPIRGERQGEGVTPGRLSRGQPSVRRKRVYFTVTPTVESHCLVMISFALPCCARLGKSALS